VISEDNNSANPNDNATGGTLTFTFNAAIQMDEVHLLDIDSSGSYIKLYGANGMVLKNVAIPNRGDNSFQVVALNATAVRKMEIVLAGSGAVAAIVSCRTEPPIATAASCQNGLHGCWFWRRRSGGAFRRESWWERRRQGTWQ
jgi:hypothetical protein